MGMIYVLKQASEQKIDALMSDPESLEDFFEEESEDDDQSQTEEDLDKSWHGLHFLFTGKEEGGEWPSSFLLAYREIIPESDTGYGDTQILRPNDVKDVRTFLESLDTETLRSRFDGSKMQQLGIYPTVWDNEEEINWLLDYFESLKSFIDKSAKSDSGLVLSLT